MPMNLLKKLFTQSVFWNKAELHQLAQFDRQDRSRNLCSRVLHELYRQDAFNSRPHRQRERVSHTSIGLSTRPSHINLSSTLLHATSVSCLPIAKLLKPRSALA